MVENLHLIQDPDQEIKKRVKKLREIDHHQDLNLRVKLIKIELIKKVNMQKWRRIKNHIYSN